MLLCCIYRKCIPLLLILFMLKRIIHISITAALFFLLLLNGISHEFIHAFTGHEDSVDCVHTDRSGHHQASFEKVHHHCDFLDLQSPVFITAAFHYSFYIPPEHSNFFVLNAVPSRNPETRHTALRGPPAG